MRHVFALTQKMALVEDNYTVKLGLFFISDSFVNIFFFWVVGGLRINYIFYNSIYF